MGELRDLIGIYGAIDRQVAKESEARADVSRLVHVYGEGDVPPQWFDDFERWTEELRTDKEGPPFPELEDALRDLGDIRPEGRMRARRLWVIALAARAFPELRDRTTELGRLARRALPVEGLQTADDEDGPAQRLFDLLADDSQLPAADDQAPGTLDEWWSTQLATAFAEGLIADPLELGPRPCTARLVRAPVPGGGVSVAALQTVFETDRLTFDQATRFLDPLNWPTCSDQLCCDMQDRGIQPSGVHRYHEVVSADCRYPQSTWTIQADLDFSFERIPDAVAIADYQLSPGPQPYVLVDEGSLVVEQIGTPNAPTLRITTTKRVKFSRPFDPTALQLMMCALGYANIVEDLIYTCAIPGKESGTPFPATAAAAGAKGDGPQAGVPIDVLVSRAAQVAEACIAQWAEGVRSSYAKAAAGRYTADDLVQDLSRAWVETLRQGSAAMDLGSGSVNPPDAGRTPAPDPPPAPEPPSAR